MVIHGSAPIILTAACEHQRDRETRDARETNSKSRDELCFEKMQDFDRFWPSSRKFGTCIDHLNHRHSEKYQERHSLTEEDGDGDGLMLGVSSTMRRGGGMGLASDNKQGSGSMQFDNINPGSEVV
nr:hypothetical protein Iba_chr15bCG8560 [Ipomoea batatas]